jgi:hypothetical protein
MMELAMHTQFPYRLLPSLQNPTREFPVAVKLHKPRDQDVSFLFGARAITSLGKKVGGVVEQADDRLRIQAVTGSTQVKHSQGHRCDRQAD